MGVPPTPALADAQAVLRSSGQLRRPCAGPVLACSRLKTFTLGLYEVLEQDAGSITRAGTSGTTTRSLSRRVAWAPSSSASKCSTRTTSTTSRRRPRPSAAPSSVCPRATTPRSPTACGSTPRPTTSSRSTTRRPWSAPRWGRTTPSPSPTTLLVWESRASTTPSSLPRTSRVWSASWPRPSVSMPL